MTIKDWQETVDKWIKQYGVRYFDELSNTVILMEEMGELSRLMVRQYGEQSFKTPIDQDEVKEKIGEEIADILFVLTCLSNQMDINMEEQMRKTMSKKTSRDKERHHNNPKLNP